MSRRHARFSTFQRMVAWTAAYALVLQVMLVSALGAGMARGPTGLSTPLCVSGETHSEQDGGSPQKAAVHCPLCLARVDAAVLPPPVPTPEIAR